MDNPNVTSVSQTVPATNGVVPAVDEFALGLLMNRTLGASDKRRPSDKSANDTQVEMILSQAQSLAKMNEQYTETYVVKGNNELYTLLGSIYSYALQINESPLRQYILQRMVDLLDEKFEIKTKATTPWITTILKFILPKERQTVSQYARVLQVAFDENLTAEELPSYIKERGGIAKITETKEEAEATKALKEHKDKKVTMLKKILLANAFKSNVKVNVPDDQVLTLVDPEKKSGTFEIAICANEIGQERRIVKFVKIPLAMENQLLAKLAEETIEDDLAGMQGKLDQLRAHYGITAGWGMLPGDKGYSIAGGMSVDDIKKAVAHQAESTSATIVSA